MKRGDFVMDLMRLWEDSIRQLKAEGHTEAAKEVGIALAVLQKTYTVDELEVTAF